MTIEEVIKKTQDNCSDADPILIKLAYDFAEKAHEGQKRKSGEPYIQHSLQTAYGLAQMKADCASIIAGLLHDVPEDTKYTLKDIEKEFGKEVAQLVKGITKLGKIKYRGIERYRESLKKMILAMAQDIRVIIIKVNDRLHNLKTLDSLPPAKQQRIAQESLEIYAPIAGLLGIERLKWQMEDICFKYLYPEEYNKLEYKYEVEKKAERQRYIQRVKGILKKRLREEKDINFSIESRMKHLYSIYRKMQLKDRPFDEIYDVFALRVITDNISDCYKILGLIHDIWKPKPGHFKDYISVPKPNGYRSLHTTVFGPDGKATEFQIRTKKMSDEAKFGIAAHWHYKTKGFEDRKEQPKWVQEILELQRGSKNANDFIKKIKLDVFQNRIFVFSPKGDVFELPEKSTPIDFAYAVHTDIGNKVSGALVNERISTLDHELKNGDLVEIRIDKNRKGPNHNWIKSVKSKKAREKIKQNSQKLGIRKFFPKI